MRLPKIHIALGTFLLALMSASLTFSTLHSHHHLSWEHPPEVADTGNCLTDDISVCPICGYLFDPVLPNSESVEIEFTKTDTIISTSEDILPDVFSAFSLGRSPPVLG